MLAQRDQWINSVGQILRFGKAFILIPLSVFIIPHSPGSAMPLLNLTNSVFFTSKFHLSHQPPIMPTTS